MSDTNEATFIQLADDGVLTLRLNRPRKKNAFNRAMYLEVDAKLRAAAKDDRVRCVVITGAGDYYSSGNDLTVFSQIDPSRIKESLLEARNMLESFVNAFIEFPKILIAAVNGPAIGIAATTLGLCDLVFATEEATFNTPFMTLGQSPEGCSSITFPKLMGHGHAVKMLLLGRKYSAKEAKSAGLVNKVVAKEVLMEKVQKVAKKFAAHPPNALRYSKRLLREPIMSSLLAANKAECDRLVERWASDECMQAIAQWMQRAAEKRRRRKEKSSRAKL